MENLLKALGARVGVAQLDAFERGFLKKGTHHHCAHSHTLFSAAFYSLHRSRGSVMAPAWAVRKRDYAQEAPQLELR